MLIETSPKRGYAKLAQSKRIDQALLSGGVTVHENLCSISTLSTDYIGFGIYDLVIGFVIILHIHTSAPDAFCQCILPQVPLR